MQEKAKAELTALQSLPKPAVKAEPAKAEEKPKLVKAEPPKPELARHEEKPAEKPAADRREDKAQAQAKAPDPAQKLTLSARDEEDDEEEADAVNIPLPKRTALDPARVKALKSAAKSEVPLSVQVGLKVKRIVIDPGHGGHDVGATGPSGVNEADVTLAISKRLKEKLEAEGYEALLTREADSFVSLEDRARFANKHKGDLFVSVHCNAHKVRKLRGVETYTLNVTSDQYSIRLAARENAASERSLSDLQFILADLATKANTSDSVRLARAVQSELVEAESEGKEKAKNLGVKQALFYVLLGAHMPSVLVETAFLSNPDDEKRLNDPAQQDGIAQAIAEGVGRFVAERDALATALTE
jgi:N-acetylmuramoyl-L-alanine amidase